MGTHAKESPLLGWVPQPDRRGTLDIIWSCSTTLTICVWAMLHLNIPAPKDTELHMFVRRLRWMLLAILAPELVMLFACGQWASAKRSVADMGSLPTDGPPWTLAHGFYADSGGFTVNFVDCVPFPVTAKQLYYLVRNGYAPMPAINGREIWDKSKSDLFAKTIACAQAAWFVSQVVGRGAQRLPTTTIEIATVAMLTCTAFTSFFWLRKPLGVETTTSLYLKCSVASLLLEAGEAAKEAFRDTPLDFIESNIYTSSQLPLSHLWGVQERPLTRIPNDRDPRLHNLSILVIVGLPTAAFPLLHLIPWNFEFPTKAELLLWRWTTVAMIVVLGIGCVVEAVAIVKDDYTTSGLTNLNRYKLRWPTNLLFLIPGAVYMLARLLIIVEIVISIRALPEGCFHVVEWSEMLPHL